MANFRLPPTESVCRPSFLTLSSFENRKKFSKRVKNIVGKGEIAFYLQFLLFPQCFEKTYTADIKTMGLCVQERVDSLQNCKT